MPYSTTWLKRGLIWTYRENVTGEELINSNMEIYGDHRFDDIRFQIVDLSEVVELQVSTNDMKKIAHLDKAAARSNPNVHIAVIACNEKAIAIVNEYRKHSGQTPWKLKVFSDMETAKHWVENTA